MIRINLPHKSFVEIYENFMLLPFDDLKNAIDWKQCHLHIKGNTVAFPRLTAYYGDHPYRYSGITNPAAKMPGIIKTVADKLNSMNYTCNAVLCNYYRNGNDSIGWHSDDEREMPIEHCITSLSIGANRTFKIKAKDKEIDQSFILKNGDLFVMGGKFQQYYEHRVPKEECNGERINLTFRIIEPK